MVRRRAAYNPLDPTPSSRWYVVRSMHGTVIESRPVVGGADLTHVFVTAMLAWLEGGWTITEFASSSGCFFCSRNGERRMVSIDPADPHEVPMYGGAHLAGRGNWGE
jgi:hypothetical protein